MGCIGLCGVVHTAQRQMTTQIPIGFCVLVLGRSLGLGLGSVSVNAPLRFVNIERKRERQLHFQNELLVVSVGH